MIADDQERERGFKKAYESMANVGQHAPSYTAYQIPPLCAFDPSFEKRHGLHVVIFVVRDACGTQ
jgi:hypothetical protein